MLNKFVPNHLHFILRCRVNNPVRSINEANEWLKKLVDTVGMKVVAGPTSVYVNDPGNEGVTGTVTLATSHASIHIWDAEYPSLVQFDIYSCKEFSVDDVLSHIGQWEIVESEWVLMDRNLKLEVIASGGSLVKHSSDLQNPSQLFPPVDD
jgi:S-adenosylmethionine/arginine decarboxylase-like enzyme